MRSRILSNSRSVCMLLGFIVPGMWLGRAQSATETVLHTFGNFPRGANPYAALTRDASGNLYGTTYQGGQANVGVVFKLGTSGKETVLHSFTGGADGGSPYAGVTVDS